MVSETSCREINMNWFVLSVGILQVMGAVYYHTTGKPMFGILYFLYALTNFVIFAMKGE